MASRRNSRFFPRRQIGLRCRLLPRHALCVHTQTPSPARRKKSDQRRTDSRAGTQTRPAGLESRPLAYTETRGRPNRGSHGASIFRGGTSTRLTSRPNGIRLMGKRGLEHSSMRDTRRRRHDCAVCARRRRCCVRRAATQTRAALNARTIRDKVPPMLPHAMGDFSPVFPHRWRHNFT